MNKKLILLALPTLMVLSSCSNVSINPNNLNNINTIREDTTAHSELFDDVAFDEELPLKQPLRAVEDLVEPQIGVQFKSYTEGGKDYYAVRYVAAIKGLDVTATWTRAVSEKNGNQIKTLSSETNATKAYKTLNNGGVISTASTEYPGYDYYLVYVMYDIPTSYGDAYMMAYLTLSYGEAAPVKSKAIVTQINSTGHRFSFNVDSVTNNYFIAIHHTEDEDTVYYGAAGVDKPNPEENDHAVFENKAFADGDTFGLFKLTSSAFIFCDYSTYLASSAARFTNLNGSVDQYGKMYLSGSYSLYVNYLDKVYVSPTDVTTTISFKPNTNWNTASATFAAYAFTKNDLGETTASHWYALSSASMGFFKADINIGTYKAIVFCRMNPSEGHVDKNWYFDNVQDGYGVWNQTRDIYIDNDSTGPTNISWRKYTLSDSMYDGGSSWDDYQGSWSK